MRREGSRFSATFRVREPMAQIVAEGKPTRGAGMLAAVAEITTTRRGMRLAAEYSAAVSVGQHSMSITRSFVRTAMLGSMLMVGLVATGCAAPLSVSPGLTESTVKLPGVKLDRKSINFGDYQVREIRRGWDKGGGISVGKFSAEKTSRDFSFVVAHGEVSMQVRCSLAEESAAVGSLVVDSSTQVVCDLNPSNAAAPWKALLVQQGNAPSQGRLQQGTRELQIVPAHGSGHQWSRGYLIREEGDVAAVDVRRKTRAMWLPKAAEPEVALALAGAEMALMLLEEVK